MKNRLFIYVIFLTTMISVVGCNFVSKDGSPVSGSLYEILVIANKKVWRGPLGDSIKAYFERPEDALPQPEPKFKVISVPEANFTRALKAHRSIIKINISRSIDSSSVELANSQWATSQKIFKISARNLSEFYKTFDKYKGSIMRIFKEEEINRMKRVYRLNADTIIKNRVYKNYGFDISVPSGYKINKDTLDFMWMSLETVRNSRGIIIFEEEYTNTKQFSRQEMFKKISSYLKNYIPGPKKGSYMALDTVTPTFVNHFNYESKYYAMNIKALWYVHDDFMGGPIRANVILNPSKNKILYVLGYVYAPDEKKRNYMHGVVAAMNTVKFDKEGQ